jgi:CRISP-associated protein Cas1
MAWIHAAILFGYYSGMPAVNQVRSARTKISGSIWADRCNYWLKTTTRKSRDFVARAGVREPLILTGHGVRLRVDHGALLVQNGFTHYPQRRETWRFFPGEWRLPSRIVVIDVDGALTFNAMAWLSEHKIPLVQIDWRGEIINIVSANPELVILDRLKSQLRAVSKNGGFNFARKLIHDKIANSIETLRIAFPKSANIDLAIQKLNSEIRLLKANSPSSVSQLMGVEGRVGYAYFDAWRTCRIKWKGIDRYPIPEEWHQIGRRSSKLGTISHPNRNATHPVNAMLNYAYAILESKVRMQLVAEGFDPTIGIFHGNARGQPGLVLDLMEPLRPIVDRKVLQFVQANTFHSADFTIRPDGVCRLNAQLTKAIVIATSSALAELVAARPNSRLKRREH